MKIKAQWLPLIFLIATTSLAQTNPSSPNCQNAAAAVSVSGVFISSYQENDQEEYYFPPFTNFYGWVFPSVAYSDTNFIRWDDGKGGTGQYMFDDPTPLQWSYTWPSTSFPQPLTNGTGVAVYLDYPDIPPGTNVCNPPALAQEHCNFSVGKSPFEPVHMQRTADTKMKLATGGTVGSTKMNLWQISVTATTFSLPWVIGGGGDEWYNMLTGTPIAPQNISILGKTLGSDGNLYITLPDNASPDATPVVSGAQDFYSFNITAQKYVPTILLNGVNVSGTNTAVVVGQAIGLSCQLTPSGPTLSNFQWTIPGNAISNYIANATNGVIYTDFPTTNSGVSFYWVDGGQKQVQCQFIAGNVTMSASASFTVIRPMIDWIGSIDDSIAVDTNYWCYGRGTTNIIWLHFGCSNHGGDVGVAHGISFTRTNENYYGYTNGQDLFCVQIVSSLLVEDCECGGPSTVHTSSGLDTSYPYSDLSIAFAAADSPALGVSSSHCNLGANESFKMYLMFQPSLPSSIPVPLKAINWSWLASASSADGEWILGVANPAITGNNQDTSYYPQWTNNVTQENIVTNASCSL